jgi:multidrug efflux pump subunit AcrA (membrane-fusion protein)
MPGQGLVVVEAPGALRFEARVPESLATRELSLTQPITVRLDGLDREIAGRIAEIQPSSDEATRTRLVKVDLPQLPELRPGRFGRLLLVTGSSMAVSIPVAALVRHGQLEGAFVVEADTARLRLVRSAREREGKIEIVSGLSGDERLAVDGADELVDGQRVEVMP